MVQDKSLWQDLKMVFCLFIFIYFFVYCYCYFHLINICVQIEHNFFLNYNNTYYYNLMGLYIWKPLLDWLVTVK